MDHNLNSGTKSVKGLTFHHFSTNQLARQFLQREKLVFGTRNFEFRSRRSNGISRYPTFCTKHWIPREVYSVHKAEIRMIDCLLTL